MLVAVTVNSCFIIVINSHSCSFVNNNTDTVSLRTSLTGLRPNESFFLGSCLVVLSWSTLGLPGLALCLCETWSCYARHHNNLEGYSNFSSRHNNSVKLYCIFPVIRVCWLLVGCCVWLWICCRSFNSRIQTWLWSRLMPTKQRFACRYAA